MKTLKTTITTLAIIAGAAAGAVQADSVDLTKTYGMIAITPYHVSASKHNFFRPDFDHGDKLSKLDQHYSQVGSAVYEESGRASLDNQKANPYICEADTMPDLLNSPG